MLEHGMHVLFYKGIIAAAALFSLITLMLGMLAE